MLFLLKVIIFWPLLILWPLNSQCAVEFLRRHIVLCLSVAETMAVDSMLPSPSSISNAMSGFEGLPGKRRKKRTSIETNVRVVLERNFNTVQKMLYFTTNSFYFLAYHSVKFSTYLRWLLIIQLTEILSKSLNFMPEQCVIYFLSLYILSIQ